MLLFLQEMFTNGFVNIVANFFLFLSIIFGILTINSYNPIVSVIFLIFLYSSVSIYLILIGMVFIGISYLLVYVGAVSILFIFILMLVNIRISELLSPTGNSIPLGFIIIISLYFTLSNIMTENIPKDGKQNFVHNENIYFATSNN
jgi:NADH-ubiquinone oxidoreductase chain 6